MKKSAFLLSLASFAMMSAMASQPLRRVVTHQLADGTTIEVTRRGNSDASWWEAADGRRFQFDSNHRLVAAPAVTIDNCAAKSPNKAMNASTEDGLGKYGQSGMGVVKSIGSPLIPVIMVAFKDKDFLPANTKEKITRFLNEEGYHDEPYAVGSVADYFRHCSYGAFQPRFEVVAKVTLPNEYKYYGGHVGSSIDARRMETVTEAVRLAEEQGVNFSKFATGSSTPLVTILHAGPGEQEDYGKDYEDYLWAHFSQSAVSAKSTRFESYLMSNETMRDFSDNDGTVLKAEYMTGIGTMCHELGHALGLPDMYDVNGHQENEPPTKTPGYWDVMDYQFMYDGFRPMEYSAYERALLGWLKVVDLDASNYSNSLTISPLGNEQLRDDVAYRIVNPNNPKDFFLFENRQKNTFYQDNFLGHGLLAWHINYDSGRWGGNRVNIDNSSMGVCVVPADGAWQPNEDLNKKDVENQRYTFPGDLFPGYAKVKTFDSSVSNFYNSKLVSGLYNISESSNDINFVYSDSQPVGVDPPILQSRPSSYYDLQGRRLTAAPKGIVITENKKYLK